MIDVAELASKSSVAWLRVGDDTVAIWHEWVDTGTGGAICVVGSDGPGASEQPLPPLADGDAAVVFLRSKADRQLAAAVPVTVEVVDPASEHWEPVTAALKAGRLNAPDLPTVVDRWARECRVIRLVPDGTPTPAADLASGRSRTLPRLS